MKNYRKTRRMIVALRGMALCAAMPLLLSCGLCLLARAQEDDLAKSFTHPPDSAKPQTWWHWMNGNITKEGITADLEAMKRVGINGAQIFNVDEEIPAGPAPFMSP
ncbi:MAG: glycosyl hydrolase, partial [Verrucomicrobiota bacterium]